MSTLADTQLRAVLYRTETAAVLNAGLPATVVAAYDGAVRRIFVDEEVNGREDLAAAHCIFPAACDLHLPLSAWLLGVLLSIAALAGGQPQSQLGIGVLIIFAALSTVALFVFLGVDGDVFLYGFGASLLGFIGAACVGTSAQLTGKGTRRASPED